MTSPNDLADARGGPQLTTEAVRFRPARQRLRRLWALLGRQPRGHAWGRATAQCRGSTARARSLEPLAHRPFADAQRHRTVLLLPPVLFEAPGAVASLVTPVGRVRCSQTSEVTISVLPSVEVSNTQLGAAA
jgi:hypothetical protein